MRILVGQVWHEGHSFNPIATTKEDFQLTYGAAILDQARGGGTAFSGIIKRAEALGHVCVPVISARARPGGPVEDDVIQEIFLAFENAARFEQFDAVCLELHGATTSRSIDDTEGELLKRLRQIVGPNLPISVALDLHAYVTLEMVAAASILTGYRTTPHADMPETGERAMQLLHDIVEQRIRPNPVRILVPFLTRGNDETSSGPMYEIGQVADGYRSKSEIIELSVFNVHPFLNVPNVGQVVLGYDRGGGEACIASTELAKMLWDRRDDFTEQLMSVRSAFDLARTSADPLVLGDQGDRVVGAGPGDSAEIVRIAIEEYPDLKVASAIYDPLAVIKAASAGEGTIIEIGVGGSVTPQLLPLLVSWTVVRLLRARFVNRGPYMAGVEADFGEAAVLRHGNVHVVVTAKAPNVHDPAFYESVGFPVNTQDVLVARAANHYKLSFAGFATPITVDTLGLTAFRPHEFAFTKARPFYPLDDVGWS